MLLVTLAPLLFLKLSTAQVLIQNGQIGSSVLQNVNQQRISLPNNVILQNNGVNGIGNSGIGFVNTGIGNVNSGIGALNTGFGAVNAGINTLNTGIGVNSIQLNTAQVGNNVQLVQNLPVSGIVTNGNSNGIITTNLNNNLGSNFGSNIVSANLINSNVLNNGANRVNANVPINIANGFNINTGTFALSNTGLSQILNIPCGIQILADALEVGGAVGVTGQLPFYTTVSVNGALPSSGSGVISCACVQN